MFNNSGSGIQHQYSKVQAWNADKSKIWLGFNWILNDSDYSLFKYLGISMNDGRWSNVDPDIRYFLNAQRIFSINPCFNLRQPLPQGLVFFNIVLESIGGSY